MCRSFPLSTPHGSPLSGAVVHTSSASPNKIRAELDGFPGHKGTFLPRRRCAERLPWRCGPAGNGSGLGLGGRANQGGFASCSVHRSLLAGGGLLLLHARPAQGRHASSMGMEAPTLGGRELEIGTCSGLRQSRGAEMPPLFVSLQIRSS